MNKAIKENITRIIGAILLIIGIITFNTIGWLTLAFFIPAIIMILANKKLAQAEFKQFILTFKKIPEKNYFLIAMYDIFSWFGLFMATYLLGTIMNAQIAGMEIIEPGAMVKLLTMTIAYFTALIALSVVIYSAFKGMIWLTILNKNIDWGYFVRFSLLNAIWFAFWIIPALIIVLGLKPDYFLYLGIMAAIIDMHMTTIMQYSFTKKNLIWPSIGHAFAVGIGSIKKFLLPYSYIAATCIILFNIFWIMPKEQNIITFASILLLVFVIAWYRQYMAVLLGKIT